MKIVLLVVGKTTSTYLKTGIDDYSARINKFMPFKLRVLPDVKSSKKMSEKSQKEAEGEIILSQLQPNDHIVLLDERGKEMTSREFSAFIESKSITLSRNLIFIVGGPYGFSEALYNRANSLLSLSRMTFPHELVRLFFVEQIYRAMTIAHNLPYHHD